MATPIVEQVAAALATTVATVTTGNGYNYTIHTVRRWSRNNVKVEDIKPHLYCRIEQDQPELVQLIASNPPVMELSYTFHVQVFISPSEEDQTAIDTYRNTVWGDVVKAVMTETYAGNDLQTLVREWRVEAPTYFESADGSYDGVDCQFTAFIRTSETDPFTQRS